MPKCNDCGFFYSLKKVVSSSSYHNTEYYCDPEKTRHGLDFDLSKMRICSEANAENCRFYKRKWYKFWVK